MLYVAQKVGLGGFKYEGVYSKSHTVRFEQTLDIFLALESHHVSVRVRSDALTRLLCFDELDQLERTLTEQAPAYSR